MEENKTVDVGRWNRANRRRFGKQTSTTIPGRNLPYVRSRWLSLEEFKTQREKEIVEETKVVDKV